MNEGNQAATLDGDVAQRQRPWSVAVATFCVALSYLAGLVSWIFTAHWREIIVPFIYAAACALIFFYVRALYRGRVWARWIAVIAAGFSIYGLPRAFARFTGEFAQVRFLAQTLLDVSAAVLLLLPSSGRWFSPNDRNA